MGGEDGSRPPAPSPPLQVEAEAAAEAAGAAGVPAAARLPFESFAALATAPRWASLEADEALTRLANAQCDSAGIDPSHLLLQVRLVMGGGGKGWQVTH